MGVLGGVRSPSQGTSKIAIAKYLPYFPFKAPSMIRLIDTLPSAEPSDSNTSQVSDVCFLSKCVTIKNTLLARKLNIFNPYSFCDFNSFKKKFNFN